LIAIHGNTGTYSRGGGKRENRGREGKREGEIFGFYTGKNET